MKVLCWVKESKPRKIGLCKIKLEYLLYIRWSRRNLDHFVDLWNKKWVKGFTLIATIRYNTVDNPLPPKRFFIHYKNMRTLFLIE